MQHSQRFLKLVEEARMNVTDIEPTAVKEKRDRGEKFHLVDVREEREWNHGHIDDSLHLSRGELESHIEKEIPDTNAEIVVFCRGGFRGVLAAESLRKMGYTNVKNMKGGIRAWKQAGLPCGEVLEE